MEWDIRNLARAIAPGVNVNPLMMIGAGMADDNLTGAFAQMGNIQMRAQALRQQQEQARVAQVMRAAQMRQQQAYQQRMMGLREQAMNQPPSIVSNAQAYMGASPEMQAVMDKLRPGPSTVINTGMGSIPSGFMRQAAEQGGTQLVPEPGGPEATKRQKSIFATEAMLKDITELESLVSKHGTEAFGDVSRRMDSLRNRYIGNISTLRNTGVLQEGELKRIEAETGDPTSLFQTGEQVLPRIQAAREEVQRTLDNLNRMYGQGTAETLEAGAPTLPGAPTQPQPATEIANDDEYRALPPGALYRGPDGVLRKK